MPYKSSEDQKKAQAEHYQRNKKRYDDMARTRKRERKQLMVDEAGGKCSQCGYNKCVAALHFHHVDPASKSESRIIGSGSCSLKRQREELKKCVLLCANCHAEVHHQERSTEAP